jgi:two-component system, cell cycle sensor histidine kinase and response regulator CckA
VSKTILLVDDEQSVRAIVVKILRRANYNVLEAEDGAAALRIADSHDGEIDLLISDMYMPGLRGPEVAQALAPKRPGLRVLFMSGYADKDSRSGVPLGANFLNKPFSGKELGAAVEAALNGPLPP